MCLQAVEKTFAKPTDRVVVAYKIMWRRKGERGVRSLIKTKPYRRGCWHQSYVSSAFEYGSMRRSSSRIYNYAGECYVCGFHCYRTLRAARLVWLRDCKVRQDPDRVEHAVIVRVHLRKVTAIGKQRPDDAAKSTIVGREIRIGRVLYPAKLATKSRVCKKRVKA